MKWVWIIAGVLAYLDFWTTKIRVRRLERQVFGVDPRNGETSQ